MTSCACIPLLQPALGGVGRRLGAAAEAQLVQEVTE